MSDHKNEDGNLIDMLSLLFPPGVDEMIVNYLLPSSVACGADYTTVLLNGTLYTFGSGLSGQLGTGEANYRNSPYKSHLKNVVQVSCGSAHTVVMLLGGTVLVCGWNSKGQLGIGNTTSVSSFTQLDLPQNIVKVACGGNSTLLLCDDGKLFGCGENNGSLTPAYIMDDVIDMSSCNGYSLAVKTDGTLSVVGDPCWSRSEYITPTTLSGFANIEQVSCSASHVVALTSTGVVLTIGSNVYGQLGNGTVQDRRVLCDVKDIPYRVTTLATQVVCGRMHTLVVKNGTLHGCGYNCNGELGDDDRKIATLSRVTPLTGIDQVACGRFHTVILKNNTVWVYGNNHFGELGVGHNNVVSNPTQVEFG